MSRKPLIQEIEYLEANDLLPVFSDEKSLVFLDSSNHDQPFEQTNRYSYLGFNPVETIKIAAPSQNDQTTAVSPILYLKEKVSRYPLEKIKDIPAFQGGIMGCFSYEALHAQEKIQRTQCDRFAFPDMIAGVYDVVIAWDHQVKRSWVISTGYPVREKDLAEKRAKERLDSVCEKIKTAHTLLVDFTLAPLECFKVMPEVSAETYQARVQKAKDYILSGDIFEINLSQRFLASGFNQEQLLPLYFSLRKKSPASFAALLRFDQYAVASASPERFLKVNSARVEARPIKGTIARLDDDQRDQKNQQQLLVSEKDIAENTMIVDLMRNDLSKVCDINSVVVEKYCGLESTASVHHLVSVVKGRLQSDLDVFDLLAAAFPAGSITGAPKICAMQIIAEIEKKPRGPYCGSIGYIAFNGDMDLSVVIRSMVIEGDNLCYQAGGAIVLDSNCESEYEETVLKARKCKEVLDAGV